MVSVCAFPRGVDTCCAPPHCHTHYPQTDREDPPRNEQFESQYFPSTRCPFQVRPASFESHAIKVLTPTGCRVPLALFSAFVRWAVSLHQGLYTPLKKRTKKKVPKNRSKNFHFWKVPHTNKVQKLYLL